MHDEAPHASSEDQMKQYPKSILYRHRKENLKKCSLRGLEERSDLLFITYPIDPIPPLTSAILLSFEGPLLTPQDRFPLFLIDGTWKNARVMEKQLPPQINWVKRSLPTSCRTAYPRKQTECPFPVEGLATVEALYIAHYILGYEREGLLDHYYWKEPFLSLNQDLIKQYE